MTADIRAGDHYLPKTAKVLEALVQISSIEDGRVHFVADGGGFVRNAPVAEFLDRYEVADAATLDSLRVFRRELVTIDDELGIPAWVDGTLWNGWVIPFFEKDAVEKLIETTFGEGSDRGATIFEDEGDYVLVETACGEDLPEFDKAEIAKLAADDKAETIMKGPDGEEIEVYVTRHAAITIKAEGREIQAYAIGDGWTWSVIEPSAAPTP